MFDAEKTKAAWEKYVASGIDIPDTIDGVRQEIVDSWRRCRGVVDPLSEKLPYVTRQDLETRLKQNALLDKIVYPYLERFYDYLSGTHHQIMLCDREGCQLRMINKDSLLSDLLEKKDFLNGKLYSETAMGTNGIGTSLVLERPVMIRGPEHFNVQYHSVSCYGAPIYDPTTHSLIGCVNITGPVESYEPMIMGMLQAAVRGIEKEFELTKTSSILNFISNNDTSGLLLVDINQRVIHANDAALELLKLDRMEVVGRRLRELVAPGSLQLIPKHYDRQITGFECTIENKNGISLDLCVSITPQNETLESFQTTMIKIVSQTYMHYLTNRVAGYSASYTFDAIQLSSPGMKNVKRLGKAAAEYDTPLLISGETGTGKEMLAEAVHNESTKKSGPFITVHCGTVPKTELESELWGCEESFLPSEHRMSKPGKIELADGGTLFLMDIEGMPFETQARFRDFLKTGQFMRIGGRYPKKADIRIICSTRSDLLSLVEKNMFRSDLYYLLSSFQIIIPPLRERPEDIMPLSENYAERYELPGRQMRFDRESMEALINYKWPGNLRQLDSVIESAVNVSDKAVIRLSSLPLDIVNDYYSIRQKVGWSEKAAKEDDRYFRSEIKEYNRILAAVKSSSGNAKEAAKALNMPLSTLYRKLSKYEIDIKDHRNKTDIE